MTAALKRLQRDVHEQSEQQEDESERERESEVALARVERDRGREGARLAADVAAHGHGGSDLRHDVAEGGGDHRGERKPVLTRHGPRGAPAVGPERRGAGRWRTAWAVAREARFALAAVITTAFGHVVAEIGSAMTVGGNIRGQTRTLTTAVALYTSQGDFGLALALGLILLLLALLVNIALQALQGRGHA